MLFSKENKIRTELENYDGVIITGASSGIGEAFASEILRLGTIPVVNISRGHAKILDGRENCAEVAADLRSAEETKRAYAEAMGLIVERSSKTTPRVLFINNAGFGAYGPFPKPSLERNMEVVELDIAAVVLLSGLFYEELRSGRGALINIASTAAFQPCPYLGVYGAAKAFVLNFTLSLNAELEGRAKCLCVCPGPTSSNFFRAAGFDNAPLPSGFGHKASDVAHCALSALAAGNTLAVVGFLNKFQTMLVRLLPLWLVTSLSASILKRIRAK